MSSVDAFGPSSQTLTFNESDELIQGATQGNFQNFSISKVKFQCYFYIGCLHYIFLDVIETQKSPIMISLTLQCRVSLKL